MDNNSLKLLSKSVKRHGLKVVNHVEPGNKGFYLVSVWEHGITVLRRFFEEVSEPFQEDAVQLIGIYRFVIYALDKRERILQEKNKILYRAGIEALRELRKFRNDARE